MAIFSKPKLAVPAQASGQRMMVRMSRSALSSIIDNISTSDFLSWSEDMRNVLGAEELTRLARLTIDDSVAPHADRTLTRRGP